MSGKHVRGEALIASLLAALAVLGGGGCGTTRSQTGTEQLLLSDAVDRSVSRLDFRALAGQTVYLDPTYVKFKSNTFVNADYVVSALRQQMFAAGCKVQDSQATADIIVEPRIGALASDGHDVTYGIPASSALSSAASLLPNVPSIPAVPEISIAKRQGQMAAAKLAVFAYYRESRDPVWQSGLSQAQSTAKDYYVFGAGPFQRGNIYDRTRFAGNDLKLPALLPHQKDGKPAPRVAYDKEAHFIKADQDGVQPASAIEEATAARPGGNTKKR